METYQGSVGKTDFEITGLHYPKVPVCRRPEYEIAYEQYGEHTFCHVRFHVPWSPSVMRKYAADVQRLMALHGGPILACVDLADVKLQRFARLFGFEPKLYLPANGEGEDKLILCLTAKKKKKNNGKPVLSS